MNQNILITGTNGGIGLAVVDYLLKQGIRNIACNYRAESEKINRLLNKYEMSQEKHLYQAELTDEQALKEMRARIGKNLGSVTSIVNIAGMSTNNISWKLGKEQFLEVINNNLLGTFLCTKEFLPDLRNNQWGRVINFSSVVGSTGVIGASHYCAAKAGIEGLSKSLALELANKNITVNTIALGYFDMGLIHDVPSEQQNQIRSRIPLNRFGNGDEVGATVKFLLDENSSYLTGQVLHLNGGLF